MDYARVQVELTGTEPLLMHNAEHSANPMSEVSKVAKLYTGKRKKTDQDHGATSRLDWIAGLYTKEFPKIINHGENSGITFEEGFGLKLPHRMLKAMIINAAKKSRDGTTVKQSLTLAGDATFEFPHTAEFEKEQHPFEWLWNYDNGFYTDYSSVTIKTNRVMRTRPRFPEWKTRFVIEYIPSLLNEADVENFLILGGRIIGLGDYRPDYGRFEITEFTPL
jgi:hypothetical protein